MTRKSISTECDFIKPFRDSFTSINAQDKEVNTRESRARQKEDRKLQLREKAALLRKRRELTQYAFSNFKFNKVDIEKFKNGDKSIAWNHSLTKQIVANEDRHLIVNDPEWREFTETLFNKAIYEIDTNKSEVNIYPSSWSSLERERLLLIKAILKGLNIQTNREKYGLSLNK